MNKVIVANALLLVLTGWAGMLFNIDALTIISLVLVFPLVTLLVIERRQIRSHDA
jgi:hypothetical protein